MPDSHGLAAGDVSKSINSILANVVAGLGLFFIGLKMVDANLRHAAGRQLRQIIACSPGVRSWQARSGC